MVDSGMCVRAECPWMDKMTREKGRRDLIIRCARVQIYGAPIDTARLRGCPLEAQRDRAIEKLEGGK